ncbi:hypothetical protein CYLTODRAFT_416275 [Cylindrobasidium torrendii FP15055 ss-10]|uniref:Uncharacterized protein n=1 Tax=Cylindrobasidium torrendii FP15055 ss-10 TaxID=1314674 RepID=A0A0D7BW21_9AGAR|nr:hypothetical protein CYLTODRAFT_416275 [Cylindrobasidium torrendii FP15055 ss-10]
MNATYASSDVAGTVISIPGLIWNLYLDYLVFYPSNSWVATIAYLFRILATILFIPLLALTLLDLVSYGVARLLGIVDPDRPSHVAAKAKGKEEDKLQVPREPKAYFEGEESNLKLAGAHDLSPVVSRSPSPVHTRRTGSTFIPENATTVEEGADSLRKRQPAPVDA